MWSLEKINKINKSIVLFKEEKKIMDGKKRKNYIERRLKENIHDSNKFENMQLTNLQKNTLFGYVKCYPCSKSQSCTNVSSDKYCSLCLLSPHPRSSVHKDAPYSFIQLCSILLCECVIVYLTILLHRGIYIASNPIISHKIQKRKLLFNCHSDADYLDF